MTTKEQKCGNDPKTGFLWVAALNVKNKCKWEEDYLSNVVSSTLQWISTKNGRKLYFTHKALSQTSLILSKMIHYTEIVSIMYNVDPVQINNFKIKILLTYCRRHIATRLKKDDDIKVIYACTLLNESSDRQWGLEHVVMKKNCTVRLLLKVLTKSQGGRDHVNFRTWVCTSY
jgi:prolyl oligopeptidase PreP (S9A serine peptidase family)